MRGVIYARYSSDNQREESIEGQLRENTAHAKKNGIEIVGTYIDRAVSAKTDNRPEFQRMIKDSSKKGFDVVIVWKLDRFARNRFDSARYKAALKKKMFVSYLPPKRFPKALKALFWNLCWKVWQSITLRNWPRRSPEA
jgi:DNA invertase Pin-like site-specific DNA recombinase